MDGYIAGQIFKSSSAPDLTNVNLLSETSEKNLLKQSKDIQEILTSPMRHKDEKSDDSQVCSNKYDSEIDFSNKKILEKDILLKSESLTNVFRYCPQGSDIKNNYQEVKVIYNVTNIKTFYN